MLHDIITTANGIAGWTAMGITLPADLSSAVETYEAVTLTDVGQAPVIDAAKLTPRNAEAEIRKLADALLLTEQHRDNNGAVTSALGRARLQVLTAAARRVLVQSKAAIPNVVEQLSPEFNRQADAYVEAVAILPDGEVSSDRLVNAGPAVVAAFGAAQRAAGHLNAVSAWVASTAPIDGTGARDLEVALRVLRPATVGELHVLDEAARLRNVSAALSSLNPIFLAAARAGISFGINTLREAAQLRVSLAEPVKVEA